MRLTDSVFAVAFKLTVTVRDSSQDPGNLAYCYSCGPAVIEKDSSCHTYY